MPWAGPFICQNAGNKKRGFFELGHHPPWLKRPAPSGESLKGIENMLGSLNLGTVCQSAQCPNIGECFNRGTATFMILGNLCTRNCRFCAVDHGAVLSRPDPEEPENVVRAAKHLGLTHMVVTSVTRDDLEDGGAGQFIKTIEAFKKELPGSTIEILVPDFKGDLSLVAAVCKAGPDVFNHNVETVPRLYASIRPQAIYKRSLDVLETAAALGLTVKSGLMLGLGETADELSAVFKDLAETGCSILTMGQYLSPSSLHAPVVRYIPPEEFDRLGEIARLEGFKDVFSGPFVRSSYRAEEIYRHEK
jgi:lipoyl synthase